MILLDLSDLELKAYGQQLSYMTYDFNMDHDLDIKPIAKSEAHFNKWIVNYPFYANIHREGVVLYGAASAVENAVEVQVAIISKHKECIINGYVMDGELLKESAVMFLHSGRFKTHL